jgi:magnesium-transporting ATPase (P-type)
MVLLACSERGSMAGLRQAVGYVETSSIDGETNLKIKLPLSWMIQEDQFEDVILIQGEHISGIEQFRGKMDFEAPNKNIHSLNGSVGLDVLGVTHPVSEKNFLIRGSILRCSSWAVGVAVYTGKDTKVSLNARAPPSKLSVVDRIVNHLLWIVLSLMFALCILSTALALMWRTSNSSARYLCLSKDDDAGGDTGSDTDGGCENGDTNNFLMFFTFTTLFNNFVCISMYITLEVVYYVQAYFIASDLRMYCSQTDSPAEARTSNMNSDLGQVQYIFTDKTGTLTKNSMVVRRVSVDGLVFGAPLGVNGDDQALTMASSDVYDFSGQSSQDILRDSHPQYVWNPTSSLKARAWGARPSLVTQEILLVMAACNTALITPPSDFRNSRDSDGRITPQVKQDLDSELPRGSVMGLTDLGRCIQAESADEAAMVVFAASEGDVLLCNRTPAEIILLNAGQLARLPLLAVNEFDSVRKRMSVVVRWRGRAILLCKGADSSVFGAGVMDKNMLSAQDHVGAFASNGLRTLVFAKRYLSEDELSVWLPQYHEALSTVVGRAERLRDVAEALEYRLEVSSVT